MEPQSIKQGLCLPTYLFTCQFIYLINVDPQSSVDWRGLCGDSRTRGEENGPGEGTCMSRGRHVEDLVWSVRNQEAEARFLSFERVSKAWALEATAGSNWVM